eukprot:EG_transcript_19167
MPVRVGDPPPLSGRRTRSLQPRPCEADGADAPDHPHHTVRRRFRHRSHDGWGATCHPSPGPSPEAPSGHHRVVKRQCVLSAAHRTVVETEGSSVGTKDETVLVMETSPAPPLPGPASAPPPPPPPTVRLFCDLDGTLSDFVTKVRQVTGHRPGEQPPWVMWDALAKYHEGPLGFYACLEWMPDGWALWRAIRHLRPAILTGIPRGNWAVPQKRTWCARELGRHVPVYTCPAAVKHRHSSVGAVLIDDSPDLRPAWESRGGIFVHHVSTRETLAQLRSLGIL